MSTTVFERFRSFFRHPVFNSVASLSVGFVLGVALFRLPDFACGPFRSELAAQWVSAVVGAVAALATFLAIYYGLKGGERAIAAERQMRAAERDIEEAQRRRHAQIVASRGIDSMFRILGSMYEALNCYNDERFFERHESLLDALSSLETNGFFEAASRVDVFEVQQGALLMSARTAVEQFLSYVRYNRPNFDNWNDDHKKKMWKSDLDALEDVRERLEDAFRAVWPLLNNHGVSVEEELAKAHKQGVECAERRAEAWGLSGVPGKIGETGAE